MPEQFMQSLYDGGHKIRAIQRAPDVVDFMSDEDTGNIHQQPRTTVFPLKSSPPRRASCDCRRHKTSE